MYVPESHSLQYSYNNLPPAAVMFTKPHTCGDALRAQALGVHAIGLIVEDGCRSDEDMVQEIATAMRHSYPERQAVLVTHSIDSDHIISLAGRLSVQAVAPVTTR